MTAGGYASRTYPYLSMDGAVDIRTVEGSTVPVRLRNVFSLSANGYVIIQLTVISLICHR